MCMSCFQGSGFKFMCCLQSINLRLKGSISKYMWIRGVMPWRRFDDGSNGHGGTCMCGCMSNEVRECRSGHDRSWDEDLMLVREHIEQKLGCMRWNCVLLVPPAS